MVHRRSIGLIALAAMAVMTSAVLAQQPRSVPGTGTPAGRPYSTPGFGTPSARPHSIPPTGSQVWWPQYRPQPVNPWRPAPQFVPPRQQVFLPPAQSPWRLGIDGLDASMNGYPAVYISRVEPESPAERMGIEAGDYIVQVNGQSTRNLNDLRRALRASNGYVRLLVLDHRTGSYVWHEGDLYESPAPTSQ